MNNTPHSILEPEIILKNISIKNFRGFETFKIDLDSKLNVIIGENGSGKTAFLDCIAKILLIFIQNLRKKRIYAKKIFDVSDFRYGSPQKPSVQADFSLEDERTGFDISFRGDSLQVEPSNPKALQKLMNGMTQQQEPFNLPLFAYYPVAYAPVEHIDFKGITTKSAPQDIFTAYDGILNKKYFDFNSFFIWYKWQENIEKQLGENNILDAVRDAVYSVLSDDNNRFSELSVNWLNDPNGEMFVHKNGIPLNINQLSSGEKTLLVIVSDLARCLVIANPHRKNPLDGYAIILIDEVDLHLHPGWQRAIIPKLQKTFPNSQFIVTTHSPLVLSKIKPRHVVILSDFKILEKTPHTFGRDTNSILYELMGVRQRPEEIQKQIDKVYELMDELNTEKAKEMLKALSGDLGENDYEIVRAHTHIHFMED
ncbi:AAA family ATPase [Desulfobacterales bacterium HSG2]|nr:AAA family ATPase [Desulfobacterales bacterium HSG2]